MTYESTGEVRVPQAGEDYLSQNPMLPREIITATKYWPDTPRVIMRPVEEPKPHIDCACWATGEFVQVPCPWHDGKDKYPKGAYAKSVRPVEDRQWYVVIPCPTEREAKLFASFHGGTVEER